ncbi:MAG: hypothetical protein HY077_11220 [Elusimicrobia bacterium]|nr:hypothetical protein [Elusimicrobiota bacterium]
MRKLILALALIVPASSFAADPDVETFKKQFADQEQILLSGVLADPGQASEFATDAKAGSFETVKLKWYGRISAFSSGYLAAPHVNNDKAAEVRAMVEPAEWAMLMTTLRKMKDGGLLQQGKMNVFIGMIDDANADLKRGDTEAAHKVVKMGRDELAKALNEYLASPNGKAGLAQPPKDKPVAPPKSSQPPKPAHPDKKTPEVKEPVVAGTASDDDEAAKARAQAERIRNELQNGGNGSKGYEGDKNSGGAPVVIGGGTTGNGSVELQPSGPGAKPSLVVKGPPSPAGEGDDMDELHKMKKEVKGHKSLFATIGGGLLGAIIGGLIGMIFGPVGMIVGAAAGAAAGAYGGHAIGKKLWG